MNTTRKIARARWFAAVGAAFAVALVCALAVAKPSRDEAREWTEFEAAHGLGLPDGCWLRFTDGGYADLELARVCRRSAIASPDHDQAPSESSYVDLERVHASPAK